MQCGPFNKVAAHKQKPYLNKLEKWEALQTEWPLSKVILSSFARTATIKDNPFFTFHCNKKKSTNVRFLSLLSHSIFRPFFTRRKLECYPDKVELKGRQTFLLSLAFFVFLVLVPSFVQSSCFCKLQLYVGKNLLFLPPKSCHLACLTSYLSFLYLQTCPPSSPMFLSPFSTTLILDQQRIFPLF